MKWLNIIVTALLVAVVAGCATQKQATQAEDVKRSGFLGDYSNLTPGTSAYEAMLRWRDPNVPPGTYSKVIIESVQIWGDLDKDTDRHEDLVALANYMKKSFSEAIGKVVPVVDEPGPGVAIIRLAITDANANNPTMKAITTIVPIGIGVSAATELSTDKPAFAGDITVEFMMLDSVTGKVYAKGIDRRVGGRSLSTVTDSWKSAYAAIDAWANVATYRICLIAGKTDCPVPKI